MVVHGFDCDPARRRSSDQPVGTILVWLAPFVTVADCLLDLKARQPPLREPLNGVISPYKAIDRHDSNLIPDGDDSDSESFDRFCSRHRHANARSIASAS